MNGMSLRCQGNDTGRHDASAACFCCEGSAQERIAFPKAEWRSSHGTPHFETIRRSVHRMAVYNDNSIPKELAMAEPNPDPDTRKTDQRQPHPDGLGNQNVTRPADIPVDRPERKPEKPEDDGLEERNVTRPGSIDRT
jgi:hypothetical protein